MSASSTARRRCQWFAGRTAEPPRFRWQKSDAGSRCVWSSLRMA